jgi:hypothetical protein
MGLREKYNLPVTIRAGYICDSGCLVLKFLWSDLMILVTES